MSMGSHQVADDQHQSQSPRSEPTVFQTLHHDNSLMLLALQEATQLLSHQRDLLQRHGPSHSLDLCHGALLRLTYYLVRCPEIQLQTRDYLALHKLAQAHLADRLRAIPSSQAQLRRLHPS